MWSAIRSDLLDFVTTIQEDTKTTLKTVLGEEPAEADEEITQREKLIADTKRSFSTYGTPVDEQYELQYEKYFRNFSLASHGMEIGELLDAEVDVSRYYAELVPAQIRPEDFWARYFFRLMLVSKGGILTLEDDDDEEELVWETEENKDEIKDDSHMAASSSGGNKHGKGNDSTTVGTTAPLPAEVAGLRNKVGSLEDENLRLRGQVKTLAGRVAELERLLTGNKDGGGGISTLPTTPTNSGTSTASLGGTNTNAVVSGGSPPRPPLAATASVSTPSPGSFQPSLNVSPTIPSALASTSGSHHGKQTTDGVAATVTPPSIGTRRVVHASPSITFPTRMASLVSTSPGTTINASDLTVGVAIATATMEAPSNFVSISTSGSPRGQGQGPGATVESTTTTGNAIGGRGNSTYSSTATTTLHGTRLSGATSAAATGESNHGSVSPLTEVTEANTRRNKMEHLHAVSGRLTAEHGTSASGGGGGGGLLRRISDNVSECTSEQEQSHGFFLSDSSAAETETGGGGGFVSHTPSRLPSFSSSLEVQKGGGSKAGSSGVSFEGGEPEEDSDGSGVLVMADGTVLTLPKTKPVTTSSSSSLSSPLPSINQSPGNSANGQGVSGQGLSNDTETANGHTVTNANGQPINGISATGQRSNSGGGGGGQGEQAIVKGGSNVVGNAGQSDGIVNSTVVKGHRLAALDDDDEEDEDGWG